MVVLVIGGLYNIPGLDKQFFPTPVVDRISIAMPFPGASPREVEEQICVRIEEAIHDLDGIKEIRSTASDGMGQIIVEALTGYPTQRLTNEIKTRVDAITTFPTDAERPVVTELIYRHMLGIVQLAGELDEWELKELGETLRDDAMEWRRFTLDGGLAAVLLLSYWTFSDTTSSQREARAEPAGV